MPQFPFTENLSNRSYYRPSLEDPRDQPKIWSNRPAQSFYPNTDYTGLGVTAGLFASGFIPFRDGRLWDQYNSFVRGVEEYSPGSVLRTFQLSNFFSQFESSVQRGMFISPQELGNNEVYLDYLNRLIGPAAVAIVTGKQLES